MATFIVGSGEVELDVAVVLELDLLTGADLSPLQKLISKVTLRPN